MDLVDLVFDAREEREVGRVNKGIVGTDYNLTVGLRCNRNQLVNHRSYNCVEGYVSLVWRFAIPLNVHIPTLHVW